MGQRLKPHHRHLFVSVLALALVIAVALLTLPPPKLPCAHGLTPAALETPLARLPQNAPNLAGLPYRYEPTVVVARSDRNWPTSLQTVLDLEIGGRITCLHSDPACLEPEDAVDGIGGLLDCPPAGGACFAALDEDSIPAGGSSDDWLVYPTPLAGSRNQLAALASAVGGSCASGAAANSFSPRLPFDPNRFAQEYFFATTRMPKHFRREDLHLDALGLSPPPREPLHSLQYWFFYPFNYFPVSLVRAASAVALAPDLFPHLDFHQGDLEHVDVITDALGRLLGIYMARHKNEDATLPLDKVVMERDPHTGEATHPVVFAGLGGHASYASCAPVRRLVHVFDVPVCPAEPGALLANYTPPHGAAVAPAYVFRGSPLVALAPPKWACWNGLFGDVPRIPQAELLAHKAEHLERLPRPAAWAKLKYVSQIYPLQAGPGAPLRQDGGACASTSMGPAPEEVNPVG